MTIKEVKGYETNDGNRYYTYKEAHEHESELLFYEVLDKITDYDGLAPSALWNIREELIKFFIERGYCYINVDK